MNLLPFGKLPAAKPRKFVPQNADLGDWPQIAPLFDALERRAPGIKTAGDLEAWLLDWCELNAALDEEGSRRYIAMTCHTDSEDAEKAYLHFVENVEPQLKPKQFALEKIYAAHPLREQLPQERFMVFDRDVKNHVELFRPESVLLETDEAKLSQQYQKLSGSLTVNFRGEEKTLVQMGRHLRWKNPTGHCGRKHGNSWPGDACRKRTSLTIYSTSKSGYAHKSQRMRDSKIIATIFSTAWAVLIIRPKIA